MKGRDEMTRSPSPAGGAEASEEEKTMTCKRITKLALALLLVLPAAAMAQTTTPGASIDLEIYNPIDGSSTFCSDVGVPFWANVYVRPGSDATSCSLACGTVAGGPANIGTGVIDVAFDPAALSYVSAETNPDPTFAAVDGLLQTQNLASGRIGWALAGDWLVDGDPVSGLNDPCAMQKLDAPGWVFRVQLQPVTGAASPLALVQQPDFALSFADMCGSPAFTVAGGGIDEVRSALYIGPCADILFADDFESGTTGAWSVVVP
jgi:hypothetical protein